MSYTKKTWASGDTVTSSALNNMEGGIDAAANPFIVTLTPTAQDFSGTMDKTVAEITAAYQAGKKIVFYLDSGTGAFEFDCTYRGIDPNYTYPSFNGFLVTDTPISAFVYFYTGTGNDGTDQDYVTTIYPLTPMS